MKQQIMITHIILIMHIYSQDTQGIICKSIVGTMGLGWPTMMLGKSYRMDKYHYAEYLGIADELGIWS